MLNFIRKIYLLMLVALLGFSFSQAYANGDCCTIEKRRIYAAKKCKAKSIKKHTAHREKKYNYRVEKSSPMSQEEFNNPVRKKSSCEESPVIFRGCPRFPQRRISCETINPSDLVDFTCGEFSEKVKTCEAYSCQAPYVLDPSVKTNWKILGKKGDRCVISNTTEDVGIRDKDGNVLPIVQTCEYDELGIKGLIQRFNDLQNRYFHFSTCEHYEGIYNCTFKSRGQSIQNAKDTPAPDVNLGVAPKS